MARDELWGEPQEGGAAEEYYYSTIPSAQELIGKYILIENYFMRESLTKVR